MLAPSTDRNLNTRQDAQLPTQANPACNFWAISQAESARNVTQRQHFPRSEKLTANNSRQKPHRNSEPMAKSAPVSCETAQNPQGRDRGQGRGSRKRRCGRNPKHRGGRPQAKPRQPTSMLACSSAKKCACSQTNPCTGCTANRRAKALMETPDEPRTRPYKMQLPSTPANPPKSHPYLPKITLTSCNP